jgi:hypothetical protein
MYSYLKQTKMENRRVEQDLSKGWYQWEGGRMWEKGVGG